MIPRYVTLVGIVIEIRDLHEAKAASPYEE